MTAFFSRGLGSGQQKPKQKRSIRKKTKQKQTAKKYFSGNFSNKENNKMNRFASCDKNYIQQFIDKFKNENTTRATSQWMRTYNTWAVERNAALEIERLDPVELDQLLQQFFAEVKKQDGDDYEPGSLSNLQSGIDRYLREKGYQHSIIKDRSFASSNAVFEEKARFIRENGKGKRPNKAVSLTKEEEETLWECGQLGTQNSSALINTIWWQFTMHSFRDISDINYMTDFI